MDTPIISDFLDTDLYKLTMGAVVFHNFPTVQAKYVFINRNKTPFPDDFSRYLKRHIQEMNWIGMSPQEYQWLRNLPYMRPTYAEWLRCYRFDPSEVHIEQEGGTLKIEIEGPWFRTIMWEVPLMALISELYFRMTGYVPAPDWLERIETKAKGLSAAGCLWSDFGTRRRFSKQVQNKVVQIMSLYKGFVGTSNPQLAFLNGVQPIGTSAHEAVMAMGALYHPKTANTKWLELWREYYGTKLSVALTDTYTTDKFIETCMGHQVASDWEGMRQDSGDPYDWADNKILPVYRNYGIPTKNKKLVFSDNLNVPKALALQERYKDIAIPVFGIGTNLSNDVFTKEEYDRGARPLNMVIKLKAVKFASDKNWTGCVKLSDDKGKYTGTPEDIARVLAQLNEAPEYP